MNYYILQLADYKFPNRLHQASDMELIDLNRGREPGNSGKKKTRARVCETRERVKKFPAPCYSPIVKFTVPSPLEPLTAVFGKGTCVSAPP